MLSFKETKLLRKYKDYTSVLLIIYRTYIFYHDMPHSKGKKPSLTMQTPAFGQPIPICSSRNGAKERNTALN